MPAGLSGGLHTLSTAELPREQGREKQPEESSLRVALHFLTGRMGAIARGRPELGGIYDQRPRTTGGAFEDVHQFHDFCLKLSWPQ